MTSGLKGLGRPVKEKRFANLDLPTPPGDPVPLPSRGLVPTKSNDVDANWLRPLAFVNLRKDLHHLRELLAWLQRVPNSA